MQNFKVHYSKVHFAFLWSWIKDKQIRHIGDEEQGMLIIYEEDGRVVGMWGYEAINTKGE
jgi:hypothetical protein